MKRTVPVLVNPHYPVGIIGGGPVGQLMSILLSDMGVKHCIVEKRKTTTTHPQAHYMNNRTMELLQSHCFTAFQSVIQTMPPSGNWRDFVYCYSVTGTELARIDSFSEEITDPSFWKMSPTSVAHLPQNKFEGLLRDEARIRERGFNCCSSYYGFDVETISLKSDHPCVTAKRVEGGESTTVEFSCDYLVGADGAHSLTRQAAGVRLEGARKIQTLLNVHFRCDGLGEKMAARPAMLYFIFNETAVAVMVAHDTRSGEYVCQFPIFPPFQSKKDEASIMAMLKKCLGDESLDIKLLRINTWEMDAVVAEQYSAPLVGGDGVHRVFLVGDSAHRFPPAGGFGMNTGLQDAHNLAWKLGLVVKGAASPALLESYGSERKMIAVQNTQFSINNYNKSAAVARALGVDPSIAKMVVDLASSSSPSGPDRVSGDRGGFLAQLTSNVSTFVRKQVVSNILEVGLQPLRLLNKPQYSQWDWRVKGLRNLIAKRETLSLIFPKEDLLFSYNDKFPIGDRLIDPSSGLTELRPGARVPHCWFTMVPQGEFIASLEHVHSGLNLVFSLAKKLRQSSQLDASVASAKVVEGAPFDSLDAFPEVAEGGVDPLLSHSLHQQSNAVLNDPDASLEDYCGQMVDIMTLNNTILHRFLQNISGIQEVNLTLKQNALQLVSKIDKLKSVISVPDFSVESDVEDQLQSGIVSLTWCLNASSRYVNAILPKLVSKSIGSPKHSVVSFAVSSVCFPAVAHRLLSASVIVPSAPFLCLVVPVEHVSSWYGSLVHCGLADSVKVIGVVPVSGQDEVPLSLLQSQLQYPRYVEDRTVHSEASTKGPQIANLLNHFPLYENQSERTLYSHFQSADRKRGILHVQDLSGAWNQQWASPDAAQAVLLRPDGHVAAAVPATADVTQQVEILRRVADGLSLLSSSPSNSDSIAVK